MKRITLAVISVLIIASLISYGIYLYVQTPSPPELSYSEMALDTYLAMQKSYYIPSAELYRGTSTPYSYFWPFTQVASATNYLASIPNSSAFGIDFASEMEQRVQGMLEYQNKSQSPPGFESAVAPPLWRGGSEFYDDNGWADLALIQQYAITGNETVLKLAETDFDFITTGWDSNASSPCPGGIFWTYGSGLRYRNVPANGPAAIAAAELYSITGNKTYLEWAQRIYDWVNENLRSPDGMYYDGVKSYYEGTPCYVVRDIWSYNQGTMIGAGALLYALTGNSTYLKYALQTAQSSLQYFSSDERIFQQNPEFNAIYFRNLARLLEVHPNATIREEYLKLMEDYAKAAWQRYRSPEGIFFYGQGTDATSVINSAGMVQIYALLAGAKPYVPRPPRRKLDLPDGPMVGKGGPAPSETR